MPTDDSSDDLFLSDDDIDSILEDNADDEEESEDSAAAPAADGGSTAGSTAAADETLEGEGADNFAEAEPVVVEGRILRHDGTEFAAATPPRVVRKDFANPQLLRPDAMRRLRLRQEQFVFNCASQLSLQLKTDVSLRLEELRTRPYQDFTSQIANPAHIGMFRLGGTHGIGLITVGATMAMTIVERLLGGPGQGVSQNRFLSEFEVVLFEEFLQLFLRQWCEQWAEFAPLEAEIIGYENHGRYLQTSPRDAHMLVLTIDATLGDCRDAIQLAVPFYALDGILQKMIAKAAVGEPKTSAKRNWWKSCDDIEVEVRAEWSAFECSVRDLLALRPGDTLKLSPHLIGKTELWCHNTLRFHGRAGLQDDRVAVEVVEKLTKGEHDL